MKTKQNIKKIIVSSICIILIGYMVSNLVTNNRKMKDDKKNTYNTSSKVEMDNIKYEYIRCKSSKKNDIIRLEKIFGG